MVNFFKFVLKENKDSATQHTDGSASTGDFTPGHGLPSVPTVPLPITLSGVKCVVSKISVFHYLPYSKHQKVSGFDLMTKVRFPVGLSVCLEKIQN
jgi:hypothetical protein